MEHVIESEQEVREFWEKEQIYAKAKERVKDGKPVYFLDGPPYTSGKVHLGTAWNKSLKDMYLRYQRMNGNNVWDRAGYDMHGLPTERATEKELGIFGKEEIRKYGVDKFVQKCKETCIKNMHDMSKTFEFLGAWMDFENAYCSVTQEYIEGVWWFIQQAAKQGRLYEAEKTMTWDAVNATALAKHELDYKTVEDNTIFVKFPVVGKENEFIIIWTTTPWTIPFNLAVMAGPAIDYVRVKVVHNDVEQVWIVAEPLMKSFLVDNLKKEEGKSPAENGWEIVWKGKGQELAGLAYTHPFAAQQPKYAELKVKSPAVHTVLMSSQFVDTETGTGLVHCAPGCGPEDYVVGMQNGIQPFNTVDEGGIVRDLAPFTNLRAKIDDPTFIQLIKDAGALVHQSTYSHDYPFGERSRQPVIFRTTKQWFLKVEDMKDKLLAALENTTWYPVAAKNAFTAWMTNLRDNSISKQRFWGTPLPIWRNEDDPSDYVVIGSAKELSELSGVPESELTDLHPPVLDPITFTKNGHVYRRVPDILDVWVDAGAAFFNCLRYPGKCTNDPAKDVSYETPGAETKMMLPAEFILEGRDQIRGWYNLLHLESMVLFGQPCFKNVFMHGFILDSKGRKMSKSLGNYILPSEIYERFGVDTMRYYMIGAANAGEDMRYNENDVKSTFRNLQVISNVHQYLLVTAEALADMATAVPLAQLAAEAPEGKLQNALGLEERYVLSQLHQCIKKMDALMSTYALNRVPAVIQDFFLEISHVYIQLIWEKKDVGTPAEKRAILSTLAECVIKGITLLAPICPFIAEKMYQKIRTSKVPGLAELAPEISVHLLSWPKVDESLIDNELVLDIETAKDAITAVLAARDKASLAVKQPSAEVRFVCAVDKIPRLQRTTDIILQRVNAKALSFVPPPATISISPNNRTLGKQFGKNRNHVVKFIAEHEKEIAAGAASETRSAEEHWSMEAEIPGIEGTVKLDDSHIVVTRGVPKEWAESRENHITAYLDTRRTEALELEGLVRETARKIQILRKEAGLCRTDKACVRIIMDKNEKLAAELAKNNKFLRDRTGTEALDVVFTEDAPECEYRTTVEGKIGKTKAVFALLK